jgi:hypothetical protein
VDQKQVISHGGSMKKNIVVVLVFICVLILLKRDVWSYIEGKDVKCNEIGQKSTKLKNGIVELKLNKTLVIDSLSIDNKNQPLFSSATKSVEKNLILLLSRKPKLELFSFDGKGSLMSRFLSMGEGPGELPELDSFQIVDDTIVVTGFKKMITYNINGKLIEENKLEGIVSYFKYFIDKDRYICNISERDESGEYIRHLVIKNKNTAEIVASLCKNEKRRDIGVTMVLNNQLYHDWITPDYKFVYLPGRNCIVCGVSDSDQLHLKDLQGKTIKTAKINFTKRAVTPEDRNQLIDSCSKLREFPDLYNGLIKKIPNEFLTIMDIKLMPQDHFAVFLGTGFKKYAIRIFDKDLNYLFDIKFPDNIASRIQDLRGIKFYKKGFIVIEDIDEENQYVEYKIENLKQVFE